MEHLIRDLKEKFENLLTYNNQTRKITQ